MFEFPSRSRERRSGGRLRAVAFFVTARRRLGENGRVTRRIIILAGIAAVVVGLDRATKAWAANALVGDPVRRYLADTLRIGYVENTGVFLGLGNQLPEGVRFVLFVVVVAAGLVAALVYTLVHARLSRVQVISLGLILSGGFSNLVDRLLHDGVVVDFMNVGIGGLRTGVFNVADMAVTAGVIVLLTTGLRRETVNAAAVLAGLAARTGP